MEKNIKTNKWSIFVGVAVVTLTVKTFLPDVWTSVGQAIQPVIDGAHRVVAPAFDQAKKNNSEDEEFIFWQPVGGKPE